MNDVIATNPFPEARVLVVDDEADVRATLARLLNLLGYHVEEASSGHRALEMLEHASYDVMVLDIRMPGLDGVEVMQRARQVHPGLPIIFLTGYAALESAIAAVKSRAADYLLKPASIHDLATAVAGALEQRARREQPRVLTPQRFLHVGPITLDRGRDMVIMARANDAGICVELTISEAALLVHLMQHPGIVISCQELVQAALNYDVSDDEAPPIIRPHISRLRKKIESDPANPRLIRTISGKGYIFSP